MKSCRTSLHKRNFYKARNSSELTGFSCFLWLFTFYVSLKNCVCFYESCLVVQFCVLSCFSCVRLFMTPWTVAHQALLSMGFSKQEYWSGLLCPPPGDLPDPGIESVSLMSPALAGGFFLPQAPPGKFYPSLNYHFFLFFFHWKILALQYCTSFCRTSTRISHRDTYVPSLLNLPPISHPIPPL